MGNKVSTRKPKKETSVPVKTTNGPVSNDNTEKIEISEHALDTSTTDEINSCIKMQFSPVNKLGKLLLEYSQKQENASGITEKVFIVYLFPDKPELGRRLFNFFNTKKQTNAQMPLQIFKQQCENFLLTEKHLELVECYVKIHMDDDVECVQPTNFRELLMVSYKMMMHHDETDVKKSEKVFEALVNSCFHGKDSTSISRVVHWLSNNLPGLIKQLHNYVVHTIITAYHNGECLNSLPSTEPMDKAGQNLYEMEKSLPLIYLWILSMILPKEYVHPDISSQSNCSLSSLASKLSTGIPFPSHWTILYDTDQHGLSWNRFTNHVFGYRGPTIIFIECEPDANKKIPIACVCSNVEWRESHLYYGDKHSMAIALTPTFKILEHAPKMLYFNMSIRGYLRALRAGTDSKKPFVDIDDGLHSVKIDGMPYKLAGLRVWACGDRKLKDRQMDLKKWELGETQKQRVVKLSPAEWMEHPDRYLLQMAGRQSYATPDP